MFKEFGVMLCLLVSGSVLASESVPPAELSASESSVSKSEVYTSIHAEKVSLTQYDRPGTISGDYKRALLSKTLQEAKESWEAFLSAHNTGDFEDGFHLLHVKMAKYELMRVFYLLGDVEQADALLREIAVP